MGFGAEGRAAESIVARMSVLPRVLALLVAVTLAGTTLPGLASSSAADSTGSSPAVQAQSARAAEKPLHGLVIALDPGHQLGNSRHTREINRLIAEASGDDDALSGKVTAVHREDNGSIRAIDDGMYQQTLKTRS